jgi:hypothetical protein
MGIHLEFKSFIRYLKKKKALCFVNHPLCTPYLAIPTEQWWILIDKREGSRLTPPLASVIDN